MSDEPKVIPATTMPKTLEDIVNSLPVNTPVADDLDAKAKLLSAAAPFVELTCEACGKKMSLPFGTDIADPGKALKNSGAPLDLMGTCKGKPAKCLLEAARSAK